MGWIVDAGTDFPASLRTTIDTWRTSALFRPRDASTTRGWNGYGANDHRSFKYLTEKKRLTAEDLTPDLLASKSFHLICSPTRCITLVQTILSRRKTELNLSPDNQDERPLIIWEPVPDLCIPPELDKTYAAVAHIDVISPNHDELASLFSATPSATPAPQPPPAPFNRSAVETQSSQLLARCSALAVVVRAGKEGCFVASLDKRTWLPAYHQPSSSSKVVDPTGGGNAFLGAFAVGLVRGGGDVVEAARWGSVGASLAIEQVGMPGLSTHGEEEGEERWNGVSVRERLEEFRARTGG